MNEEDRQLLQGVYKLAEENNQILKRIERSRRWAVVMRITYWIAIVALSFGAYYLIQPYIDYLKNSISDLQSGQPDTTAGLIQDLLN